MPEYLALGVSKKKKKSNNNNIPVLLIRKEKKSIVYKPNIKVKPVSITCKEARKSIYFFH